MPSITPSQHQSSYNSSLLNPTAENAEKITPHTSSVLFRLPLLYFNILTTPLKATVINHFHFEATIRFTLVRMAPASNEEQFKFLISCIRYSNNGKVSYYALLFPDLTAHSDQVDFEEVAKECDIVSKGAA